MKQRLFFSVVVGIVMCGILTAGCSKDDDVKMSYTVIFDAVGGTPVPASQRVEEGGVATAPATNPTKQGNVFLFWQLEGATTAYNFQTPVKSNITLVAKWQEEATVQYWQVAWELDGGVWPAGDNHATQVVKGGTLAEPAEPTKAGNTFDGWYKEAALTHKVTFPYDVSGVTGNITLYAKWKTEVTGTFTIRNTADWNSAVNVIKSGGNDKSYTLVIEGTVSVPPTTGVEQGKPSTYTFGSGDRLSVTLTGNGTLTLSAPGFLMCLSGYVSGKSVKQNLIIDGPTLQGRTDNTVPLLRLDYANLELKAGKITENNNNGGGGSGNGGGVYIRNGYLTMSGGEISNNICGQKSYVANGGGVAIIDGNFIMSGGVIKDNTGDDGGGVYFYGYNITMTGGVIKGNTSRSSSPYGGGVYYRRDTNSAGSFTKTGGIIYGSNAAESDKNKVIAYNNTEYSNCGAAVFYLLGFVVSDTYTKRRETTLGENDNISTDEDTGWGL